MPGPGWIIDGRFEIAGEIGSGGAARIYRATDRLRGQPVAVKLLERHGAKDLGRFAREAAVLSRLVHPNVVRYVAHGLSDAGEPYLVMEWIEGEHIGARLRRAPPSDAAVLALIAEVARALAWLHGRGVVHRDLKPANVVLREGRLDRPVLIDFGLARVGDADDTLTSLHAVVGTPGYMAPEQVRGQRGIDGRADVFALGCVLFRCLAGRAPYTGDGPLAIMAKIALDDAPSLHDARPDLPREVTALAAAMLQKSPAARPSGEDLVRAIEACVSRLGGTAPAAPAAAPHLTGGEQKLVSVLLVDAGGAARGAELTKVLRAHGADPERLRDGTAVVALSGVGAATDQAARAARCALAVRAALPDAPIALATGRGMTSRSFVLGEAIDRAAWMLDRARRAARSSRAPIAVDDVTAGLAAGRFELGGPAGERVLTGERADDDAPALLGRRTPFVGRQQEISVIEAVFEKVSTERAAHAVVVSAPAGAGKSRLARELVASLRAKGEAFTVWSAGADPARAGTPFGLLGAALKRAAGIAESDAIEGKRAKIAAFTARRVPAAERDRVATFLGAMVQIPISDAAGRVDAALRADQVRRAFLDLVAAEHGAGPLLLVLEDLHWADRPSVELVDAALRLLADAPLMVLVMTRPEIDEVFPDLFRGRARTELRLAQLSRRAVEALVADVIGDGAPPGLADKLSERSGGNAFFLEELLRAEVEGRGDAVPDTVLAMVEARFASLPALSRRVLRAASVLGQVFWRGALRALLGGAVDADALDDELGALIQGEWIAPQIPSRFSGDLELGFRHALVREAAHGLLTDEDRVLGHRLAGEWLEAAGEGDAALLADHFARGEAAARAVRWYRVAAEQALAGQDMAGAIARAARGIELGAAGVTLGELALLRAEAHGWRGELAEADHWARQAMELLPREGASYHAAVYELLKAATRSGSYDDVLRIGQEIAERWAEPPALEIQVAALALAARGLMGAGDYERARVLHARVEEIAAEVADAPICAAEVLITRSWASTFAGDYAAARAQIDAAILEYERAGDLRGACRLRVNAGHASNLLGAYADAAAALSRGLAEAERLGLRKPATMAKHNLGAALLGLGELDRAAAVEREAVEELIEQGDRRIEGSSRAYLAAIYKAAGDLARAEAEARLAVEILVIAPPLSAAAIATLADILLDAGRVIEARDEARRAAEVLGRLGVVEEGEALVRVVYAAALAASGDRAAARAVIKVARDRLVERAAKIAGEEARTCFLTRIPEHARTLALARELSSG